VSLGFITQSDLVASFGPSFGADYFYLNPDHFPKPTQALYAVQFMLKHGVLPLGLKTEHTFLSKKLFLNIGILDPGNHKGLLEAETIARAKYGSQKFGGLKVYLILADQLLEVLRAVYGVGAEELKSFDRSQIDQTLKNHLQSRPVNKPRRSA
jgi:hypothetical protein